MGGFAEAASESAAWTWNASGPAVKLFEWNWHVVFCLGFDVNGRQIAITFFMEVGDPKSMKAFQQGENKVRST